MYYTLLNTQNEQFVLLLSVTGKYIPYQTSSYFFMLRSFSINYCKQLENIAKNRNDDRKWVTKTKNVRHSCHARNFSYCFLSCCKRIGEKYTLRDFFEIVRTAVF